MTIKYIQAKPSTLFTNINSSVTSIIVNGLFDIYGNRLTMADFGSIGYSTIEPRSRTKQEIISFTGITDNGDGTDTLTGVTRGLNAKSTYLAGGVATDHNANVVIIVSSNNPQLYNKLVDTENDQTIGGEKTFTLAPKSSSDAVLPEELVRYSQLVDAVLGALTSATVVMPGTAGETLTVDTLVYLNTADNEWYESDANDSAKSENVVLGITRGAGTNGNSITNGITLLGQHTALSAIFTPGIMYISDTAGEFSATPGTKEVSVGVASSTTVIDFKPRFNQQITEDEQDALQGTSGIPSNTNRYVTDEDTSPTPSGDKVMRWDDGAYPAGDGSEIIGVAKASASYTASGSIEAFDATYVASANTVATVKASGQDTVGSYISTSPTTINGAIKTLPLSTNGMYIHFNGGAKDDSLDLVAQVRTMNSAETDFSNGSEVNVFTTGNGTRQYSVKEIGTDKFMVIYQVDTSGAIACVVLTVSGTTITVGTPTTIESGATVNAENGIAKLGTDKCAIFYKKESDGYLYVQVLTVSGTTITTNTPVVVNSSTFAGMGADRLADDVAIVVYANGTQTIRTRVVTFVGTVPTVGGENAVGSSAGWESFTVLGVSATKAVVVANTGGSWSGGIYIFAISGTTVTAGSILDTNTGGTVANLETGLYIISEKLALAGFYKESTTIRYSLIDISGTSATLIENQDTTTVNTTSTYEVVTISKVKPWVYIVSGSTTKGYVLKLTDDNSTKMIGIANADIANAGEGTILYRYNEQTPTSIALTAGSKYYVDDTGQPTTKSSLVSPVLGIAISTSKIMLQ